MKTYLAIVARKLACDHFFEIGDLVEANVFPGVYDFQLVLDCTNESGKGQLLNFADLHIIGEI